MDLRTTQIAAIAGWMAAVAAVTLGFRFIPPRRKQAAFAVVTFAAAAAFLAFAYINMGLPGLYFALVPLALVVFLNIRAVRFCRACGAMNRAANTFAPPPKFCMRCAAPLGAQPSEG